MNKLVYKICWGENSNSRVCSKWNPILEFNFDILAPYEIQWWWYIIISVTKPLFTNLHQDHSINLLSNCTTLFKILCGGNPGRFVFSNEHVPTQKSIYCPHLSQKSVVLQIVPFHFLSIYSFFCWLYHFVT